MNNLTKEQIEQIVSEVSAEFADTALQEFYNTINTIPDEEKENPFAYHAMTFAASQRQTILILNEVLKRLLAD